MPKDLRRVVIAWACALGFAGGCGDGGVDVAPPFGGDAGAQPSNGSTTGTWVPDASETAPPDASLPVHDAGSFLDATLPGPDTAEDASVGAHTPDATTLDATTLDAEAPGEDGAVPLDGDTIGDAGSDATGMGSGEDVCGPIPTELTAETAGRARRHGFVEYDVRSPNEVVRLQTRMTVPAEPPPSGTVFLWPGLQPFDDFRPPGNGVLQPVLTWGPSCVPNARLDHASWWISSAYVNVTSNDRQFRGCKGGPVIDVSPTQILDVDMVLNGQEWNQIVTTDTGEVVDFPFDLGGQRQGRALFVIELPGRDKPIEDLVFTSTVLTFAEPLDGPCTPTVQGAEDYVSTSRLSADGLHCCIDRMALRADGVPASTSPRLLGESDRLGDHPRTLPVPGQSVPPVAGDFP